MIGPLVGAAASALLLGLVARCASPFHLLAFVALVPWLVGLDRARSMSAAILSGLVLSLGFTAGGFGWFPATVAGYAHISEVRAWTLTLVLAPLLIQPQLVVVAVARRLAARGGPAVAAAVTTLGYVGAEWALPKLFRDTLGYGLYPSEVLRQAADLAGVGGLTLLVVAVNAGIAALAARRRAPLAAAVVLTVAGVGYGAVRLDEIRAATVVAPVLRAGVVQASITRVDKLAATAGTYDAVATILDAHFELSERLLLEGPLDVIIWPETTYPTTFGAPRSPEGAAFDRAIAGFVRARGVPLVFGAFEREGDAEYNAAFFLGPRGDAVDYDTYRKTLLFPVTERLPGWLDGPRVRRAMPFAGRWTPGPGPRAVALRPGLLVGPLICYEAIDPAYAAATVRAGADVLVTLSNDAWFPTDVAPRLHLIMAAFRSIETRRAMVRDTNSGMSALVLPDGTLVSATPFAARAAFRADVPLLRGEPTLFVRWGDWLGPTTLALGLALALWGRLYRWGQGN